MCTCVYMRVCMCVMIGCGLGQAFNKLVDLHRLCYSTHTMSQFSTKGGGGSRFTLWVVVCTSSCMLLQAHHSLASANGV